MKPTILLLAAFAVLFHAHAQWVRWEVSAGGNGHWYKAVPNTNGLSWEAAATAANLEGGYLATIASAAENEFVFGLVNSPEFFTEGRGSGPAIGGYQPEGSAEPEGGWSWVTGETWGYSNWYPGQPDNFPGGSSEERLHYFSDLARTPAATWNDLSKDDLNLGGHVVERENDPAAPLQPVASIFLAVEVCWQAEAGRRYQVQWTESLTASNWVNLGAPVQAANELACLFDSSRGRRVRFYRIQLLP